MRCSKLATLTTTSKYVSKYEITVEANKTEQTTCLSIELEKPGVHVLAVLRFVGMSR